MDRTRPRPARAQLSDREVLKPCLTPIDLGLLASCFNMMWYMFYWIQFLFKCTGIGCLLSNIFWWVQFTSCHIWTSSTCKGGKVSGLQWHCLLQMHVQNKKLFLATCKPFFYVGWQLLVRVCRLLRMCAVFWPANQWQWTFQAQSRIFLQLSAEVLMERIVDHQDLHILVYLTWSENHFKCE